MVMDLQSDNTDKWRVHWPVVAAATAGMAMSTILVYSVGLFFEPLQHEFGWTRSQISFGPAMTAVASVLINPIMGAAIDRFGPRRFGLIGVSALTVMTALLGLAGPSIVSWWILWVILSIVFQFVQPTVWTSAVAPFFKAKRGFALAITLCGSGIGSIITPMLTYLMIEHYGWRRAFLGLAILWGGVVIPLIMVFFTSRLDQARSVSHFDHSIKPRKPVDIGSLLSRRFLQLALAGLLIAGAVVSLAVSLVPILSASGLLRGKAVGVASLLGFASITGRLTVGYILDHVQGRFMAAFSVCLPIVTSILLLIFPGSIAGATVAVLILGLALGAELDLIAYLTSRYFSLQNFGLVFGTVAGAIALAGGIGPWLMNLVYDNFHSYVPALFAVIPMCLASAILFLLLGPYPARDPANFRTTE